MPKWITMGAAAMDTIIQVPHLPKADEIVYPLSIDNYPGGSTANIAVGLSRLGEKVMFFGKAGQDDAGRQIKEAFLDEGVNADYLAMEAGNRSGGAFIAVDPNGERVIYSLGGNTLYESWEQIDQSAFEGLDGLYIGETFAEVGQEAADLAHKNGATVFFGPGGIMCGYGLEYLSPVVERTDYLLVNLPEALTLSGCTNKDAAIATLLDAGVKQLIITEGSRGAGCYSKDGNCFCSSYKVKAIDTTGAGDTFTAGFLRSVLSGMPTEQCLRYGNACASVAVQAVGARSSMPTLGIMNDVWQQAQRGSFPDRAYAAICALALGDSMGMPTEFLPPEDIKAFYGRVETIVAPHSEHYHYKDMTRGMITDDTEVTLEVMRSLVRHEGISVDAAVDALLTWVKEKDVFNKSYLGPTSEKALKAILSGVDPVEAGREGTTNGAAMRIVPIGIINPGDPTQAAIDASILCIPTHGSNLAMAGAGAIASAIAEALSDNSTVGSVLNAARAGASSANDRGYFKRECTLLSQLDSFLKMSESISDETEFEQSVFDKLQYSMECDIVVPVILTLFARYNGNAMSAIKAAVNIGGDTDTIAALAGAICGAFTGTASLDMSMVHEVEQLNSIDLRSEVNALLSIIPCKHSFVNQAIHINQF